MITIENRDIFGWDAAIRGARNPMNSWEKSDSEFTFEDYDIGPNDLDLLRRLSKAGPDHGKYLRMIHVQVDITAPAYFDTELDTYKVGTVRNSCSLQHKGASRNFSIRDFSVADERVYEILDPIKEKKEHPLTYPYKTEEYRTYSTGTRTYRVYRNGRIISEGYTTDEKSGRRRKFGEREVQPYQTSCGYYIINIGGSAEHERWAVHRLVATVWIKRDLNQKLEVNHIDGNKGNNSVENLEWVTHQENEAHKHEQSLDGRTLHSAYLNYKASSKMDSHTKTQMREMRIAGATTTKIAEVFGISQAQAYNIVERKASTSPYYDLFEYAEQWEEIINALNSFREKYLDTGDVSYFLQLRAIMPMGYNYRFTWDSNYAVLKAIYHARKKHMLPEWRKFCEWIETLPYARELICYDGPDIHVGKEVK